MYTVSTDVAISSKSLIVLNVYDKETKTVIKTVSAMEVKCIKKNHYGFQVGCHYYKNTYPDKDGRYGVDLGLCVVYFTEDEIKEYFE